MRTKEKSSLCGLETYFGPHNAVEKNTRNTEQQFRRRVFKHLHNKQCDEGDQKGPGLGGEIEEVHLCTFSLVSNAASVPFGFYRQLNKPVP